MRVAPRVAAPRATPMASHMAPFQSTTHRARPLRRPRASQSAQQTATASSDVVADAIAFLREDLQHLFDDVGIDTTRYADNVIFEDPITRHTSLSGYLLNIQFLRRVFDPRFELLDIRQTGPSEVTTRWSMAMTPTFVPPPLRKYWSPSLTFTGTSVMGIDLATGKFTSHADTWDAVENQRFFSGEAFAHMLSQVFDLRRTPQGLEIPPATVILKRRDYEVRRYDPIVVAEAPYGAGPMGSAAFGALAGYIFGRNGRGEKMAMTTPVLSDTAKMQFYLGSKAQVASAPPPLTPGVEVKEIPGGLYAVAAFSGIAGEGEAAERAAALAAQAAKDELPVVPGGKWTLARYNDPSVPPPFRLNEVLVPLDEERFKLW